MTQRNPYLISGPALISFSGGRTSAFMLWNILHAHGGALPNDVVVAFANTGKEREETLRFVHECGSRWGIQVHWLEWRKGEAFERVGFNSASRNGEPFAALVAAKSFLPNWQARFCTQYLKVEVLTAFAASLGWKPGNYAEVIGLRDDEGLRILKGIENARKHGRICVYPLAKAKVRKLDVMAFWAAQEFDLGLKPWEGNCDLCFLKGRGIRERIIREHPEVAIWWIDQERSVGGRFDNRISIEELFNKARAQPDFFDGQLDEEFDAECGLHCDPATVTIEPVEAT